MLRRIFGPKRGGGVREEAGENYEDIHNFYSSPDIITVIRCIQNFSQKT